MSEEVVLYTRQPDFVKSTRPSFREHSEISCGCIVSHEDFLGEGGGNFITAYVFPDFGQITITTLPW